MLLSRVVVRSVAAGCFAYAAAVSDHAGVVLVSTVAGYFAFMLAVAGAGDWWHARRAAAGED